MQYILWFRSDAFKEWGLTVGVEIITIGMGFNTNPLLVIPYETILSNDIVTSELHIFRSELVCISTVYDKIPLNGSNSSQIYFYVRTKKMNSRLVEILSNDLRNNRTTTWSDILRPFPSWTDHDWDFKGKSQWPYKVNRNSPLKG